MKSTRPSDGKISKLMSELVNSEVWNFTTSKAIKILPKNICSKNFKFPPSKFRPRKILFYEKNNKTFIEKATINIENFCREIIQVYNPIISIIYKIFLMRWEKPFHINIVYCTCKSSDEFEESTSEVYI